MKNILVAIDFKGDEKSVIDKAKVFALAFGSKLWVMHIAAPDPDFVGYGVGPQYIRDARADELRNEHRLIQEYADKLEESGVKAEGLLVAGATIEMIMQEAKRLKADIIVTGHHDHGFFYKAFVGSTSTQIIKQSKIPVLIVPLN